MYVIIIAIFDDKWRWMLNPLYMSLNLMVNGDRGFKVLVVTTVLDEL